MLMKIYKSSTVCLNNYLAKDGRIMQGIMQHLRHEKVHDSHALEWLCCLCPFLNSYLTKILWSQNWLCPFCKFLTTDMVKRS